VEVWRSPKAMVQRITMNYDERQSTSIDCYLKAKASCRQPPKYKKCQNEKFKSSSLQKVSSKMACTSEFNTFLLRRVALVKIDVLHFLFEVSKFDIKIIQASTNLRFGRLGTVLKRFVEAKSFRLHVPKPK